MENNDFKKGEKGWISRLVNPHIQRLKSELNVFIENSNELQNQFDEKYKEMVELKESIEQQKQRFKTILSEVGSNAQEVLILHKKIFSGDNQNEALAVEIVNHVNEIESTKENITTSFNEIKKIEEELFGFTNESGEKVAGIKAKINNVLSTFEKETKLRESSFDEFLNSNNSKSKSLFNQIEDLLKGASTVALANAFHQHKESIKKTSILWICVFIVSICLMMSLSLWGFIYSEYSFNDMWQFTLGNLPFLIGGIWMAVFSSRQLSQNKRLQQEYAYKEDVAKVYYGLKKEVEKLGKSELGRKLNEMLLSLIIKMVAQNPSITLEKDYHKDKGPLMEVLSNVKESLINKPPTQ